MFTIYNETLAAGTYRMVRDHALPGSSHINDPLTCRWKFTYYHYILLTVYTATPAPYQNSQRMYVAWQHADCLPKLNTSNSHISAKRYSFLKPSGEPASSCIYEEAEIVHIISSTSIKNDVNTV